jgi:succinate dehydrogenase/fumarate reductase-like Fe-S protein
MSRVFFTAHFTAFVQAPINYGCEEGKCGSCEHKGSDGKKYRICVAKVPKTDKPLVLKP